MFSIFTYVMSRVTHSKPGLPMVWCMPTLMIALKVFQSTYDITTTIHVYIRPMNW